jgi:hypothetical protein
VELEFLLYRQVYQSDFIAKCMSHEGFLARRGVLELAASGADLGILEWWGCKENAREAHAKFLKPRPFNKNHTHFNVIHSTYTCILGGGSRHVIQHRYMYHGLIYVYYMIYTIIANDNC